MSPPTDKIPDLPVPVGHPSDAPPGRVICAPWISRPKAAAVFAHDPWTGLWGRRPTLWAAYVWCFCVTWPVSIVELAGIPLMLFTALRIHRNYRFIPSIILQPLLLAVTLFGVVQFASGLWTPDRDQWLQQSGSIRWLWSLFMLWPLIEHRRRLILCVAAGCLVGNVTQISQLLHLNLGWPTPTWNRAPDRASGWWPPVVCGTILTAVAGLHLPALILPARPAEKRFAALALAITLAGIIASGTRGAWFATLALLLLSIPPLLIYRVRAAPRASSPSPSRTRWLAIAGLVVALAAAAAWSRVGESVLRRAELARQDISAAIHARDYTTDTGARIGMALWAADIFRAHPITGVGAGGFRSAARQLHASRGHNPDTQSIHDHAHNALLHIAATTGLLGLLPALAVLLVSLRNAAALGHERWRRHGAIEWGPFFALVGLLLVSAFDAVHINAQTSALLAVLLSLCPSFIPHAADHPAGAAT